MDLDKEVLEVALSRQTEAESVKRILVMDTEHATAVCDNFLSTMWRVKMTVVLGDGRRVKKSLVVKAQPPGEAMKQFTQAIGAFKFEIQMYANVLSQMEKLMQEFGDPNEVICCKMIYHVPYTLIVFEDLKESGFSIVDRKLHLGMEHTVLALRALGRLHAMSKILEERGIVDPVEFKPFLFMNDAPLVKKFIYNGLQILRRAMETHWDSDWERVARKLNITFDEFFGHLQEYVKNKNNKFICLNHGDCWANNMMFKYDCDNRPINVRLVDMQINHYNSPVIDLLFFIYTSVEEKLRRENFDRLIEIWHKSLMTTLDRYGYHGYRPTCKEFIKEIDLMPFYKLTCILINIITKGKDKMVLDLEGAMNADSPDAGHNEHIFRDETLKQRWGPELWQIFQQI